MRVSHRQLIILKPPDPNGQGAFFVGKIYHLKNKNMVELQVIIILKLLIHERNNAKCLKRIERIKNERW
ncbi:hypothetical protein [Acinetobacter sp. BSP-28]|uniref:hypothetical protein n=1 Tax=Acinetobacter sp. BSP-28 TaxID=3344661 RepID=UPI003770546B